MSAADFVQRFGGSCRTKHVLPLPIRRRAWLQLGWAIARNRMNLLDRRLYPLPPHSDLPPDLIRLDPWEASYLYVVAAQAERGIVEVGRMHGGSTFLLAAANTRVPIWSIDLAPTDDRRLRSLLDEHRLGENVELVVGDSQNDPFPEIGSFDVLFVDGDHSYAGCSADLRAFMPRLAPHGHVVLHDTYQGSPVQQAVIDYLAETDLEVIRSPYIPAAHWHTSYGSLAHLRRPRRPAAGEGEAQPGPQALQRQTPPRVPHREAPARRAPIRRRSRALVKLAAAAAILTTLFVFLPEALGDWPYDPISHASRHHHVQHALPARSPS